MAVEIQVVERPPAASSVRIADRGFAAHEHEWPMAGVVSRQHLGMFGDQRLQYGLGFVCLLFQRNIRFADPEIDPGHMRKPFRWARNFARNPATIADGLDRGAPVSWTRGSRRASGAAN